MPAPLRRVIGQEVAKGLCLPVVDAVIGPVEGIQGVLTNITYFLALLPNLQHMTPECFSLLPLQPDPVDIPSVAARQSCP